MIEQRIGRRQEQFGYGTPPGRKRNVVGEIKFKSFLAFAILALGLFGCSRKLESAVHTTGDDYAAKQMNAGIKNLTVVTNPRKGILTISFDWESKEAGYPYNMGQGLLVRLFDGNGRYLTHFTTQETFVEIMGEHDPREWKGGSFTVSYPVNELVLKAARKAEVGAVM